MGETISTLVFRPPPATPIRADKFFHIRIPKVSSGSNDYQCYSATCGSMSTEMGFFSDEDVDEEDDINEKVEQKSYFNNASGSDLQYASFNMQGQEGYSIPAFFLRRKGAKVTILFSHGNAEDLGMMHSRMKEMAVSLCCNILAYDYTGYGLSIPSTCKPSEAMCYRNIDAAYNHLTNVMKIPPSEIILYGRSLGSGPSCYLAKKTADEGNSVGGLILHSPFLSIYRIVFASSINLVGDMFINRSKAKDIRCPVLIIHGTKDDVVPFWHGDELLRTFLPQYRAQPYWVEGLGHNQIEFKRREEFVQRITSFIEKYVVPFVARLPNEACTCIPEHERYNPEKSLKESGKLIVNRKWMKYGFAFVNGARGSENEEYDSEHSICSDSSSDNSSSKKRRGAKFSFISAKNYFHDSTNTIICSTGVNVNKKFDKKRAFFENGKENITH